jgi:hypothetical protein
MPTLATLNQRGNKRKQDIKNTPKVDVKHPADPSISNDNVRHPVLNENVLSQPLNTRAVGNVNLKSGPPNLSRGPPSVFKGGINTKQITPKLPKSKSDGPPNPTPSSGDKNKLPLELPVRHANPSPPKLPRSSRTPKVVNKLDNDPSNNRGPIPNHPVLPHNGPPPKPRTPRHSTVEKGRSNKGILSKCHLLNRGGDRPSPRPRNPPNHISPIKLNPVPSIPIKSMKTPPKSRNPPNRRRQKRNLKPNNIPRAQKLPKNIPPPSPPHPVPNLIKIRPRNRRKRGKQIRPLSEGGPPLDRAPVMSHKMHRIPTSNILNNSNKIPNKPIHPIRVPPPPPRGRRRRLPTPPHVIPNHPKPPPQLRNNPIPNGGIVRIPVHKHHHRSPHSPVQVHGQPHPTSQNPPTLHKPKVAATPQNDMR